MKCSQEGLALIKKFEGCKLKSYKCSAGVWTIGYGHTAGVKEGDVISQPEADKLLEEDIAKFEDYVKMKHINALITHWKDANNLTTDERSVFDRQIRESVEEKTNRLNNKMS